jgi:radical SAM/SPASM domain FxsB family protein
MSDLIGRESFAGLPIDTFIVKVASRCNLACSYCYEFFAYDQSWRTRPSKMNVDTARQIGKRVGEHAIANDLRRVSVLLHGGEPLLVGIEQLEQLLSAMTEGVEGRTEIRLGLQTNGVLLDEGWLRLADRWQIDIGLSCDGPPDVANKFRVDHAGRGSGGGVEHALRLLKGHSRFSGILSVIDPTSDPIRCWRYLSSWLPPMIDFLLPHRTWETPPYDLSVPNLAPYGDWLIRVFDEWMSNGPETVSIRYFEELISRSFGGCGSLESLGEEPVTLLVVNVDGEYEGVDSLKASRPGAWITGFSVAMNPVEEVYKNALIRLRQSGGAQLATECEICRLRHTCGGGYLPHRYHARRGFRSPSVYCRDIMRLTDHVQDFLRLEASK